MVISGWGTTASSGAQSPGPNVIKLFKAIIYDFLIISYSACPWQAFTASLMFVSKAGVYPRVEHLKGA
jgi:hypothetical protein